MVFCVRRGSEVGDDCRQSVIVLGQVARIEQVARVQRRIAEKVADGHLKVARLLDHVREYGGRVHVVADHVLGGHLLLVEHVENARSMYAQSLRKRTSN